MMIAGFFISKEDIEKLRIYEDVLVQQVILPRNSCSHLLDENYVKGSPKYCPECGTKTHIIPGKPAVYEKKLVGYYNDFFHPKSLVIEKCKCEKGCDDCKYNCELMKVCDGCYNKIVNCNCSPCRLECNECDCEKRYRNCECASSEVQECKRGNCVRTSRNKCDLGNSKILTKGYPDLSRMDSYIVECSHYEKCKCKSYKNHYVLRNSARLSCSSENIFVIWYDADKISMYVDDDMLNFKNVGENFLKEFNIKSSFEISLFDQ